MSDTAAATTDAAGATDTRYAPSAVLAVEGEAYVSSFLCQELKSILDGSERATFLANVDKWRRMALSEPESASKTYPWQNASNIVTPIMAQKQNTIYAKLIAMFSTKRPFWACDTEDVTKQKAANAISKLMNFLAEGAFQLNIDSVNRVLFYDLVLLGTQVVRVPWLYESWPVATKGANGAAGTKSERVMHDGPAVVPVRLEDFFVRSYYDNVQRAPYVATRMWLTHAELLQRQANGIYDRVDEVESFYAKELTKDRKDELQRRGFSPDMIGSSPEMQLYPVYEAYVFYDADGDGVPEDIKVWLEVESGVILRSEANTLGARDIAVLHYFRLPYQLMGLGLGHYLSGLQEEADFLHNHRIDNLHFSLIPAYKRRRGSGAKKQPEIHPGAILDFDDINDIQPFVTPDLTGSSYQAEMLTRDYADRVSGANDPMSGYADTTMKSGADVGSTLMLAEQGNSILNAIYDGIENDYGEIGQLVLMQLVANADKVDLSMLTVEEQALVQEVLSMPVETLPTTFSFRVQTTDQSRSEETKRQTLAQASALYAQYGQFGMQLGAVIDNPQIPPQSVTKTLAQRLFIGSTTFLREAFGMMKVEDIDMLLPDVKAMEATLKQQAGGAADANGAGAMGAAGLPVGVGATSGQDGGVGASSGMGMVPPTAQAMPSGGGFQGPPQ
jgi:hypothetical protein